MSDTRLAEALPALLLDMVAAPRGPARQSSTGAVHVTTRGGTPPPGTGTWARLIAATHDRDLKDSRTGTTTLTRRGVALGHTLDLGAGRTLGLAVQHQIGRATVTKGGAIDITATAVGISHHWDRAPVTLRLQASATTLSSDLAVQESGTRVTGLSGTGLTAGIGADYTLALAEAATVTVGAEMTHARVTADGFTARRPDTAVEPVTGIRGKATTLALRADWHQPRPTGALFAGARLDLPLEGSADARVGDTPLSSTQRASLGVQGGVAFDRTVLSLGYARQSGGESLRAGLSVAF